MEWVCGRAKRKLENGDKRLAPQNHGSRTESPEIAGQRLGRARLTRRNVGGSHTPRNHTAETGLAGWGPRIRTREWRNQNPLPYHLATPHRRAPHPGRAIATRARPVNSPCPFRRRGREAI